MTDTFKTLAQVTLGTAYANIYAPAAGVQGVVKYITIQNTDSVDRTVSLCVNGSTEASNLTFKGVAPAGGGFDSDSARTFSGDALNKLMGKASVAGVVVVTVHGVETS